MAYPSMLQVVFNLLLYLSCGELKLPNPHHDNKFYFFAYGSSMFTKRMAIGGVKFEVHGPAHLPDHRLDFITEVPWWNGAIPTVCKEIGETVWGVLYVISWEEKPKLDEQEGVTQGWYHEELVSVYNKEGIKTQAVTCIQNHSPRKIPSILHRPMRRRPSTTYLKVMIFGATESGLPARYIDFLYSIPHNGRRADEGVLKLLGPPFLDFHQPSKADKLISAVQVLF